ncbi:MAG TPA: MBL fold metallo-hydrolase [Solirubrobacterales bacterium]|nr:MBL fold metallo-hydrolase [Solirubrobacterales bacterium]
MRVEWFGQSAFCLRGAEGSVFIDPFDDISGLASRGIRFEYPAIDAGEVDLVLITHEHRDHNGVEAIAGEPAVLRSRAGKHDSPIGAVLGIASEHDDAAGTERGDNTIFAFELEGMRVVHFGDFGQSQLRPEQAAAIGAPDLLLLPIGGGPTIGAAAAAEVVAALRPRWVVPMHFRTPRVSDFVEPADEFLALMERVERLESPSLETDTLPVADGPVAVVPASP